MFQIVVRYFILEKGPYLSAGTLIISEFTPNVVDPAVEMYVMVRRVVWSCGRSTIVTAP